MFYFNCFNVEDPEDASVGLIDGQLSIPGNLLRREVFDPVINQVSLVRTVFNNTLICTGHRFDRGPNKQTESPC